MVNLRILIALLLFVSISCACFYGGEFDENFDFCKGIFKTHLGLGLLTAGIISMAIANADGKYPMYASVIATSSLAYNSALFISRGI